MLILDSDHVSLLYWGESKDGRRVFDRLNRVPPEEVATTIVSYEEQTRGWFSYMAQARTITQQIEAYRRLHAHLDFYGKIQVLDFDAAAAVEFQNLKRLQNRVGTFDLRIAAIAISRQATLLTRNTIDFERLPGLRFADWTLPEA